MTDKAISPLRRRMIEDMTIRKVGPKTQAGYIRAVKNFADFLGHSPDRAGIGRLGLGRARMGQARLNALRFTRRSGVRRRSQNRSAITVANRVRTAARLTRIEGGRRPWAGSLSAGGGSGTCPGERRPRARATRLWPLWVASGRSGRSTIIARPAAVINDASG
jgi:hypothetical protein